MVCFKLVGFMNVKSTRSARRCAAASHAHYAQKKPEVRHLVWLDLEMTGLNPDKERIIEIALVITDLDLRILAEFPGLAIYQPEALLSRMDQWNRKHHKASGLLERVRQSRIMESQAEWRALDFLQRYVVAGLSPLCGNTVHQDRRFLAKYMPKLERYFHYRNLDVSTLKELSGYWRPEVHCLLNKQHKHRALDDIRDSIAELKVYRQHFLRS